MNALLLNRSGGASHPRQLASSYYSEQLLALQLSDVQFEFPSASQKLLSGHDPSVAVNTSPAHFGGVNAIEIDKFEGRYLLSGGADSTVSIWDLEAQLESPHHNVSDESFKNPVTLKPIGSVARSDKAHKFGITDVSWYPFDSYAFITSSFDATLKIYDSISLAPKASFALDSAVYSHSMSPIAQHLLVACGTQYPAVRLVDLRSGAAVQALVAHTGAVLTTAWSPRDEYIVASGSSDGTVRLWDVRRSAGQLGVLDMEDSVGIPGYDGMGMGARSAGRGRAHVGTVNGLSWTKDGRFLVSTGHDETMRVWDIRTGANTLANFGPLVKNKALSKLIPCLAPTSLVASGRDIVFFPSEKEILMYELFEGRLMKRLRVPGSSVDEPSSSSNTQGRLKALAWRPFNLELYAAQTNGHIGLWRPWTAADERAQEDFEEDEDRKSKRKALDDIYREAIKKRH